MDINPGLLALLTLVAIHLFANQGKRTEWLWHGRFLSFAAGISFAYVFIDLLPALAKGQPALQRSFAHLVPYLDKHAYIIALIGVLFYYGVHTCTQIGEKTSYIVTTVGYVLFNFFMGASLSDSSDPELQPLLLFTIAMGLHYFIKDHNDALENPGVFKQCTRWLLAGALIAGYIFGQLTHIPDALVAIAISFISGGVLLNVLRYELPKREKIGYLFFVAGAVIYSSILLGLGDA